MADGHYGKEDNPENVEKQLVNAYPEGNIPKEVTEPLPGSDSSDDNKKKKNSRNPLNFSEEKLDDIEKKHEKYPHWMDD